MMRVRVLVLSDIHSNLEALTTVLKTAGKVDQYLCLGDIVGYGANPNEVIQILKQHNMQAIKGNHEDAVITGIAEGFNPVAAAAVEWTGRNLTRESLAFLNGLSLQYALNLDGTRTHMVHGSPRRPLHEYVYPDESQETLLGFLRATDSSLLLLGHTHVPMDIETEVGSVLNPGSVGQPRDGDPRASFAILQTDGGSVARSIIRVEYDIEKAAKKILDAGLPSFDAERLYQGL